MPFVEKEKVFTGDISNSQVNFEILLYFLLAMTL